MGTNYYSVNQPSHDEKKVMFGLILDDKYDELKNYVDETTDEVHIGKSSAGWQFLFNHNNEKYYELNKDSIDKYLRRENRKIVDEYGVEISVDDFWKKVDEKKDGYNNYLYYTDEKRKKDASSIFSVPHEKSKYDDGYYQIMSDDLFFSSSDSFC
jgi:hypothetical protein